MANSSNFLIAGLGGTALVLGVAFGLTSRDYRAGELDALNARVTQMERDRAAAAQSSAESVALQARIAELETALAKAQEAARAAAEAPRAEPAAQPPVDTAAADFGDPEKGAQVFKKCQSCHSVGSGAEDRVGPHLNGIFGRRAGAHGGFNYSQDMAMMGADGLTWTIDTLNAYLENPKALVSRTRMNFRGLKDSGDRADILAFLRQFSDNPQNIPEAMPTANAPEVSLSPEILAIVGDPEYGQYLASECETCHQRTGADDGIPSITQWPNEDFVTAMHAYKQKIRPHPVMQMMAARLSDEEIAALAAYFGDLD